MSLIWKIQPIFISSTFTDMMAERDYLRDVVFPELAERLRERQVHLEPVDLRWGVETVALARQEQKELEVLKVCLNEIERCRPFLIAMLGDRYGWIPPERRMQSAVDEKGFSTEVKGKSVTALEIEFGVLASPAQQQRSLFYFREPLPYEEMPPDIAALYSEHHNPAPWADQALTRLNALKTEIENKLGSQRVRRYRAVWDADKKRITGLKEWGRQVLEDLWRELEEQTRVTVAEAAISWQEQERRNLEAFVEERARGFVGRQSELEKLRKLALSSAADSSRGICVTSVAGGGKSALFAQLVRLLQDHECLLLANAAGISATSTSIDALLRRWIEELADYLKLSDPDPAGELKTLEEKKELFGEMLSRAATRIRVVCMMDALNQFERTPAARFMSWLPELWPENARLICTAIPGEESEALSRRPGFKIMPLEPVPRQDAEEIVHTLCRFYHKTVHPDVVALLTGKKTSEGIPAAGNPLWLSMAVEELLLLDEDDFARIREYEGTPEQRLHQLLLDVAEKLPPSVEVLYEYLLARAEKRFGESWLKRVMELLALSRWGLREEDLRAIVPGQTGDDWEELRFVAFRRYFRAHLVQKGGYGRWDFTHSQMRETLKRRFPEEPQYTRRLHHTLTDHLLALDEDDPLRENEGMYHLIGADDRRRAARFYAEMDRPEEATRTLAAFILEEPEPENNPGLEWTVSLLDQPHITGELLVMLCNCFQFDLHDVLEQQARLAVRLTLLRASGHKLEELSDSDPTNAGWQRDLSVNYNKVGDVLEAQGDLGGALTAYRENLRISEWLVAADFSNAGWQRELSACQEKVGNVLLAQGDLGGSLTAYRESLRITERLAAADPSNAGWQRDLGSAHCFIGMVLQEQGKLSEALQSYQTYHKIMEGLVAADPSNAGWQADLGRAHCFVGIVLQEQGKLSEALQSYQNYHKIMERLAVADALNAGWQRDLGSAHCFVGIVLQEQGKLSEALQSYQTYHKIMERLAVADALNAGWQRDLSVSHEKVGEVLQAQGDLGGALIAYQESLNIAEHLAMTDPSNGRWQRHLSVSHDRVGDVLEAQGDLGGALKAYRESLRIRERLAAADPSNAGWQRDLSVSHGKMGHVLRAQGDLSGALTAYRESLSILESLSAADPSNAGWQQNLTVSYTGVGDVLEAQGDLVGALKVYRESLRIRERLVVADPSNTGWQRDLSVSHDKVGEVLEAQGDLGGALKAYRESLRIRERLAAADPSNAGWQRDLSVIHNKVGEVLLAQGDLGGALKVYRASLEIAERLAAADPSNAGWQRDLWVSFLKIAVVLEKKGDESASDYLKKAYEKLMNLKQNGLFVSEQDEQVLEQLQQRIAK